MEHRPDTAVQTIRLTAWWILVLSSFDSVLSIIDRQAVAILKVELKSVFDFGDAGFGLIASAFLLAYAAFNIPSGWLVDRFGSRVMLTMFVAIWSAATFATGLAQSFEALVAWRFVLGAAEAGLVPATMYALLRWFPMDRLTTVYSLRGPITSFGPILAPPVVAGLALAFGWREAFFVLGTIGFAFALAWWLSDRSPPGEAPRGPREKVSFKAIFTSPIFLILFGSRLISDPLWFFIQFWQPGYFQEELGLSLAQIGTLLWIPPLVSTVLAVGASAFADRLMRSGKTPLGSRATVMIGVAFLAPVTALIPLTSSVPITLGLFTLAQFMCWTWLAVSSVIAATIAPKGAAATTLATLNAPGIALGGLFNLAAGVMVESWGYGPVFAILAVLHPMAAMLLFVGLRRRGVFSWGALTPRSTSVG